MANQRKKGVERVTLTIPDELLAQLEAEAEALGKDRLSVIREALRIYLTHQRPTSTKRGAKEKKK